MRCVKPCGSTVPYLVSRLSKSANVCGEQSEGESIDEVTIALCYRDEFADCGPVARIMATIRMILSLPLEEEKSQNPVHTKTKTLSLVLIPLLAYLSTSPTSRAVTQPPDGGYPAGNTARARTPFLISPTATYNTAVGWFSLQSNLTGNLNTAIGAGTFLSNTADNNTDTGAGALLNNNAHEQHGHWSVRPF